MIIANNVMAHIPDPNDFVAGMAHLLASDGLITVENPSVWDLVERCAFDTIYHEHFFYHSCTSVKNLVERHGLHLNHVEYFPDLHGGTNRWHIGHRDRAHRPRAGAARRRIGGRTRHVRVLRRLRSASRHPARRAAGVAAGRCGPRASRSPPTAPPPRAPRCSTPPASPPTSSTTSSIATCTSRVASCPAPTSRSSIPPCSSRTRPTRCCCSPGTSPTEIMSQQSQYAALGGRFIVPVPDPELI